MGENTKIEWAKHTFNPWWGCTKVAAGCTHCYAEALSKRTGRAKWGDVGTRVMTSETYWKQPLKWNREAEAAGIRERVFCASMADVFEDWSGPMHNAQGEALYDAGEFPISMTDVREDLFRLIDATPHLDWLLLTKRPENINRMWPLRNVAVATRISPTHLHYTWTEHARRENVWLLTSIAEQADYERNKPELLACGHLAAVLGFSCEPLLGPLEMSLAGIDWVILGNESQGPMAGRFAEGFDEAARGVLRLCKAARVPVLVKQRPHQGRVSHDMAEWPEDLRVREFPKGAA
jgi:protein gp37